MAFYDKTLKLWFSINRSFSLTENKDPFGDLGTPYIWKYLESDLTLLTLPPIFIVKDILQILQYHKSTQIKEETLLHEDLFYYYRNSFINFLIHKDNSIHQLSKIFISKGRSERKLFLPFIIRRIARAVMDFHSFPFTQNAKEEGQINIECDFQKIEEQERVEEIIEKNIVEHLKLFIDRFDKEENLFSEEEVDFFSYIRREADITLIREYQKAKNLLHTMSSALAHKAHSSHSLEVKVEKGKSLSMGGISGITCGGALEKISSIVPSELAMMETDSNIDLFDIHLLENRLLSFSRDSYLFTRRFREFHIVFLEPNSFNFRPQFIEFRLTCLFMSILANLVTFYREYFGVRNFTFHFILPQDSGTTDEIELLQIIKEREFPDVTIDIRRIKKDEKNEQLEKILSLDDYTSSVVFFAQNEESLPDLKQIPLQLYTQVRHGGQKIDLSASGKQDKEKQGEKKKEEKKDKIIMDFHQKHTNKEITGIIKEKDLKIENMLQTKINLIRDKLFMCISGAAENEAATY